MIIDINSGFQNRQVELSICTPEIFSKILELFNIPQVADIMVRDNAIYREVFRIFIGEHEVIMQTVHENLTKLLDFVEDILGNLKEATDYRPKEEVKSEENKHVPNEVTVNNIRSLDHAFTNSERLMYLYCAVRNYCSIIKYNRRLEFFLSQDISHTITRLVQLRRAIIMGGISQYQERLAEDFETHKEAINAFDQKAESESKQSEENKSQEDAVNLKEVIGKLSREEYNKKYAKVTDLNYCIANFSGVLEFDEGKRTNLEKEAEVCQTEIFKLVTTCWKKKVANNRSETSKNNISSIVNSVIFMSEMFNEELLFKSFDPAKPDLKKFDE